MTTITFALCLAMAVASCEAGLFDLMPTSIASVSAIAGLFVSGIPELQPLLSDAVGLSMLSLVVIASGLAYHIMLRNARPLAGAGKAWRRAAMAWRAPGAYWAWGWQSRRLAFCVVWR